MLLYCEACMPSLGFGDSTPPTRSLARFSEECRRHRHDSLVYLFYSSCLIRLRTRSVVDARPHWPLQKRGLPRESTKVGCWCGFGYRAVLVKVVSLLEKLERVEEAVTVPHLLSRPGVVHFTWAL